MVGDEHQLARCTRRNPDLLADPTLEAAVWQVGLRLDQVSAGGQDTLHGVAEVGADQLGPMLRRALAGIAAADGDHFWAAHEPEAGSSLHSSRFTSSASSSSAFSRVRRWRSQPGRSRCASASLMPASSRSVLARHRRCFWRSCCPPLASDAPEPRDGAGASLDSPDTEAPTCSGCSSVSVYVVVPGAGTFCGCGGTFRDCRGTFRACPAACPTAFVPAGGTLLFSCRLRAAFRCSAANW